MEGKEKEISPEILIQTSLQEFKEVLDREGWRTADGEDYCKDCWIKYINIFDEGDERDSIVRFSSPISEVAKTRKARDGWNVNCNECDNKVFVPYNLE